MAVKANVTGGAMIGTDKKLAPVIADKGDMGLSAYQVWLAAGNVGDEAAYQASLTSKVPGANGNSGWTPVLAGEADGTRTLIKVIDWTGGQGTKPNTGMYIGTTGYVTTKVDAFNFNAVKRVMAMSAVSNAQGIATFNFTTITPVFAVVPAVVIASVVPTLLAGATRATEVANSRTKNGVQVKVEQMNLLGTIVSLLAGATVNIIIIEL